MQNFQMLAICMGALGVSDAAMFRLRSKHCHTNQSPAEECSEHAEDTRRLLNLRIGPGQSSWIFLDVCPGAFFQSGNSGVQVEQLRALQKQPTLGWLFQSSNTGERVEQLRALQKVLTERPGDRRRALASSREKSRTAEGMMRPCPLQLAKQSVWPRCICLSAKISGHVPHWLVTCR
jgi:hypothetical protein